MEKRIINSYEFNFERVKNDINGNPVYRIYPLNFPLIDLKKVGRGSVYIKGYFFRLQSYDIKGDLKKIFDKLQSLEK